MKEPLLSIVIANYNYGRFLPNAIESVVSQGMGDKVELIICDGGSTDNSCEVIKRYADKIAWWCSEKDDGQSAAFNKGFYRARGRFLCWLNADDIILPGVLEKFEQATLRYSECEWFGGGCIQMDPDMRVFKCDRARAISQIRAKYGLVHVTGPSSFFSRKLYCSVGKIDERFHYTMDIDLWAKFALLARAKYIPFIPYAWGLRLHPNAKMSGHKFSDGGKILEGRASREAYRRDTKRFKQLELEYKWKHEALGLPERSMPRLLRYMSASYGAVFMSRIDTWRWRGKLVASLKF